MLLRRIGLWIPILACTSLPASAQQSPAPDFTVPRPPASAQPDSTGPIFTLHATARLVVLDVIVNDSQGPVKNLKASDFLLTEDGVQQRILSVTEHDASDVAPPESKTPLPPNTFATHPPISPEIPKVVIVMDNLAFSDAPFVRDEIRAFLKTLTPGTPISIFRIDWQGLHLVQSLTADPAILQEAASSQRILPPLGFPVRYLHYAGSPTRQLAGYLAAIPGRINLVWFGAGMPGGHDEGLFPNTSSIPPDLAAFVARENGTSNVLRLSRIALYPIASGGLVGNFGPAPDLLTAANSGTNSNFGLQGTAMDSYAAGAAAGSCQELMEVANSTGGKAYCNTNGFKEALADVVRTGSHYYTISYSPTNSNWNGAYRQIKVIVGPVAPVTFWDKLANWLEPLNGNVLYRDGYYARNRPDRPAPTQDLAAESPAPAQQRKLISYSAKGDPNRFATTMQVAMAFGMATPFQLPVQITITPSLNKEKLRTGMSLPKENFLAASLHDQPFRTMKIHYSVAPKDLQFTRTSNGYTDTFEFTAVVYRDDGLTANSIDYTASIEVNSNQYAQIMAKGLSYDQTIAIPITALKDNFFLRAGVHELSTHRIGTIEIPSEWIKLPAALPIQASVKPAN